MSRELLIVQAVGGPDHCAIQHPVSHKYSSMKIVDMNMCVRASVSDSLEIGVHDTFSFRMLHDFPRETGKSCVPHLQRTLLLNMNFCYSWRSFTYIWHHCAMDVIRNYLHWLTWQSGYNYAVRNVFTSTREQVYAYMCLMCDNAQFQLFFVRNACVVCYQRTSLFAKSLSQATTNWKIW